MSKQTLPIGLQLMTKDGRSHSNAIVLNFSGTMELGKSIELYVIEFDAGNIASMTIDEIRSAFHIEDREGFRRQANYPAWVEARRSRILANRKYLKPFTEPAVESPQRSIDFPQEGTTSEGPTAREPSSASWPEAGDPATGPEDDDEPAKGGSVAVP